MADQTDFSPIAAAAIWVAALIGSWVMALAVLGSVNGSVGCPSDPLPSAVGDGGVGSWVIVGVASVVPILVMTAVAPNPWRLRQIGLAVSVAALGLLAASVWLCL